MSTDVLSLQDVNSHYGQAHILQDVTMALGNKPVALVGRNGMGKTTLCKAIMGLIPTTSGQISFQNQTILKKKPHHIARLGVGYVPQGRHIFPSLSVHEHLVMMDGRRSSKRQWNTERIYELFPRLYERRTVGAGNLSGGEQQMLAIGRALLVNAKLLIMDEPSEGLAPVVVDLVIDTLHKLSGEGISLLIVEQKLAVAAAIADRIMIMVNGRIAHETTAGEIIDDEETQRQYLGIGHT